jgi:hypothetical protein
MHSTPVSFTARSLATLTLACALWAQTAQTAQAAGTVELRFVEPEKFSDIGISTIERERSLSDLGHSFQGLGRFLPDNQTLRIEVLDIDLAGEPRPGTTREVRIVRGGIDIPRITLRYSLVADGKTLNSGDAKLSDANYLQSSRAQIAVGTNLPYERRMLESWARETFVQAQ